VNSPAGRLSYAPCASVPAQFPLAMPAPTARKSSSCYRPSCRVDVPESEFSLPLVHTLVGAPAAAKDSLFFVFPASGSLFYSVFVPRSSSDLLSPSTNRVSCFAHFFSHRCPLSSFPPTVRARGHFSRILSRRSRGRPCPSAHGSCVYNRHPMFCSPRSCLARAQSSFSRHRWKQSQALDFVRFLVGGSQFCSLAAGFKVQVFLVLAVLSWWILGHTCEVFDEMCMKQEEALLIYFWSL
jgi:hypothetical protein